MKARGYRPIDPEWTAGPERLHKLLARAGFGSRRACEDLIAEGRVSIDGTDVKGQGDKVDPAVHDIRVDGERIRFPSRKCYLLNKPPGYICTNSDELNRGKRAVDLIVDPGAGRLYTVGRLDMDSEGLILVTNDGELTQKLTHPSFRVPKVYKVTLRGAMSGEDRDKLMGGVWLADGKLAPDSIRFRSRSKRSTLVEVTLTEGKNREIRRLFAKVHHPVSRLQRTKVGPLSLGDLQRGQYRELTDNDVEKLLAAAELYKTGKLKAATGKNQRKKKPAGDADGEEAADGRRGKPSRGKAGTRKAGKAARGKSAKAGGRGKSAKGPNAGRSAKTTRSAKSETGKAGGRKTAAKSGAKGTGKRTGAKSGGPRSGSGSRPGNRKGRPRRPRRNEYIG